MKRNQRYLSLALASFIVVAAMTLMPAWRDAVAAVGSKLGAQLFRMSHLIEGEDETLHRLFGGPKGSCAHYSADGVIKGSRGMLISIYVFNASANDDFIIYDNASAASGTKLIDALNLAAGFTAIPNYPAAAANGMYLDLTSAGSMQVEICSL